MQKGYKVYTPEELYALNSFLRRRENLPETRPLHIVKDFFIFRTPEGVDWMVRKEGENKYRKMFCLESWKRFNWGVKPLKEHECRNHNPLPRAKPYAKAANDGGLYEL